MFSYSGGSLEVNGRQMNLKRLSEEPVVAVFENVLDDEECNAIIELSRGELKRSKVGTDKQEHAMRTSRGAFLDNHHSHVVSEVENRLCAIIGMPLSHAENLHILHYRPGEEYKAHMDSFTKPDVNNRIATMVVYLNNVEEGGETLFPKLGISIPPKRGTALYFEYFYNDPKINALTLHAGSPVISGEKWASTLWVRRQKFRT
ncbi:2OG-Fe(II) oxygenase [Bacillus sp. H-16]|uniref:2OG-Fe(II) oxygenase n=1 Tax=Alteribacter salitolerans TaxID=2912333 RepID=UPI0019647DAE|nr:2OG-Fe(II) oxygenase [Alteribacter salitolerans]MBM7095463.1 2OG-Fe(II) oxygenase [Alteribacter salitolerans]